MVPTAVTDGQEGAQWALRFISGKYQGGEFPLRPEPRDHHRPLDRSRHGAGRGHGVAQARARSRPTIRSITIQDLGSTNGTFVNGEKVRKADLQGGRPHPDRHVDHQGRLRRRRATPATSRETEARSKRRSPRTSARRRAEVDGGEHRGDPAARPAPAAVDQPQVRRAGGALRPARRQDLPPQGADLLRQHREPVQHRPAQGADPHAGLDAGLVRARAARRVGGARRDGRLDRGAADRGHAPARRVQAWPPRSCPSCRRRSASRAR